MLVEKILENGNKLWVDFATKSSIDDKDICNTTYKNTEVYNLEMRKFTFSSLGESLLAIYNSNSISKTREANIKITKEGFEINQARFDTGNRPEVTPKTD